MRRTRTIGLLLICSASLCACASRSKDGGRDDPWEKYNRQMYQVNTAIDRVTLKPLATAYRSVTPRIARKGIHNAVQNLEEPWTMINAALQAKPRVLFNSMGRFLVNSTFGFAGLRDQATKWGVQRQKEDFGQTLAVWGVPSGPFLILPLLGPSTPRDGVGFAANFFFDPVSIALTDNVSAYASYGRTAVELVNLRTNLLTTVDPLLNDSADPYVVLRSAYLQNRTYEINDRKIAPLNPLADPFEISSPILQTP
jgi:phospholipid-binding lipoprotein MlaA